MHFTESCEENELHLITHVETTAAPIADGEATSLIRAALEQKQTLPPLHMVNTGYLDAELLVTSQQEHGIELLGPTRPDYKWQDRAGQGFNMSSFVINWEQQQAICPMGRRSSSRTAAVDRGRNAVIKIRFSRRDCQACVSQPLCTREARRTITVRPHEQYLSMQAARQREQTEAYKLEYAMRAGIEGTISQAVRAFGIRRARYMGAAKIHLQNILTAAAINFVRVGRWVAGARPARTRQSSFVALMTQAAALG